MYIRVFFIASVVRLVRDGWLLSESDRCILRYFGFSLFRRPLILILCSSFLSPVYLVLFLSPAYFYFVYFCSSPGLFLSLFIFLSFIQSFSLVSFFILIFVVSVRTFLKFPMLNISCVFLVLPCYFFIIFPFKPPPPFPTFSLFFFQFFSSFVSVTSSSLHFSNFPLHANQKHLWIHFFFQVSTSMGL